MSAYQSPKFPQWAGDLRNTADERPCDEWLQNELTGKIHSLLVDLGSLIASLAGDGAFKQQNFIVNALEEVQKTLYAAHSAMYEQEIPETGHNKNQVETLQSLKFDVRDMCGLALTFTDNCIEVWRANWKSPHRDFDAIAQGTSQARTKCLDEMQEHMQRRDVYNPQVIELINNSDGLGEDFSEQLEAYYKVYVSLKDYLDVSEWSDTYLTNSSDPLSRSIRLEWIGVSARLEDIAIRVGGELDFCEKLASALDKVSIQLDKIGKGVASNKFPDELGYEDAIDLQWHTGMVCDALSSFSKEFSLKYEECLSQRAQISASTEEEEDYLMELLFFQVLQAVLQLAWPGRKLIEDDYFEGESERLNNAVDEESKGLVSIYLKVLSGIQGFFKDVLYEVHTHLEGGD